MTNTFRTVLKNAFDAGNKKAIGTKPIEGALHIPFGVYCQTMLDLQANLHGYVAAQAISDTDKAKAGAVETARTAVYDNLKDLMEKVRGIICEAGDLLYLQLAAYKLAKSKDVENDDGSFVIGTKRLVPVSATSFRVIVEALLGNKIAGNTWDIAMRDFRAQTDAEKQKIQARLDKRNASMKKKAEKKAEEKPATAAKKSAEKPQNTPDSSKTKTAKGSTKAPAVKAAKASKKPVVAEVKQAISAATTAKPEKVEKAEKPETVKADTKAQAPVKADAQTVALAEKETARRLDGTLVQASA